MNFTKNNIHELNIPTDVILKLVEFGEKHLVPCCLKRGLYIVPAVYIAHLTDILSNNHSVAQPTAPKPQVMGWKIMQIANSETIINSITDFALIGNL